MVTRAIMAALETSSVTLLEVGQSPNAFFVNVTKCKAPGAAASFYPFPTYSHIKRLLIYCSRIEIQFPRNWFRKDRQVIGLGDTHPHLGRAEWDLGKREWGHTGICEKPKLIFLSSLPCCLHEGIGCSNLLQVPNYLSFLMRLFSALCPSSLTCYYNFPSKCTRIGLFSVTMIEVSLNGLAAVVTGKGAALTRNKEQNDWEEWNITHLGE